MPFRHVLTLVLGFTIAVPSAAPAASRTSAPLSPDAQILLNHIRQLDDNRGAPFAVIDKRRARLWVFGADGRQVDSTPVLLGLARGDDSVPGIGERPLSQVRKAERTTPAGRFMLEAGRNLHGEQILWVDYDAAVSMHRVRANNPLERRLQRLSTPTAADNRISYGCINVPTAFFDTVVAPTFMARGGPIYILPEVRTLSATFPIEALPAKTGRPKPP